MNKFELLLNGVKVGECEVSKKSRMNEVRAALVMEMPEKMNILDKIEILMNGKKCPFKLNFEGRLI